jgi:tripartite-type tricarboxylate transporter receptor subunit TctC
VGWADVAAHASGWRAAFGQDFISREDGYRGFARAYGLSFAEPPKEMDLSLTYRALAGGQVDLIAGNMDFAQIQIFQAVPHVRGGKLRCLGVTGVARSPLLPEVATAQEQGVKGFSSYNWNGVLAPAGTPKAVVDRIHGVLAKPLNNAETRKQMEALGYEVSGDGPGEYAEFIRTETAKWAGVARAAGLQPE